MENLQEKYDELLRKADNLRKSRDYYRADRDAERFTYEKSIDDKNKRIQHYINWVEKLEEFATDREQEIQILRSELAEAENGRNYLRVLCYVFGTIALLAFIALFL